MRYLILIVSIFSLPRATNGLVNNAHNSSIKDIIIKNGNDESGPCLLAVNQVDKTVLRIGNFIPQCDEYGNYKLLQRHASTRYAWCVDVKTGVEIEGTRVKPGEKDPICGEVNELVKDEEFKLERNKLLTTLPSLEKEYSVSFQIKPNSYSKEFRSVIHLTIDDDIGQYGERTPGVWFSKDGSGKLSIASAVNDDVNYSFLTEPLPLAKWTSIKISQVELKGVYSFNCYVNGEPVHSIENKNPQLFEHVKVYVADPWYNAQDGSIKEIRIQNGKDEFDGGLSEWSSFSECSATCGDSTRTRTRTCTDPTPTENGKNCDGELTETVNCNVARCKETDGYNQEGVTVLN